MIDSACILLKIMQFKGITNRLRKYRPQSHVCTVDNISKFTKQRTTQGQHETLKSCQTLVLVGVFTQTVGLICKPIGKTSNKVGKLQI